MGMPPQSSWTDLEDKVEIYRRAGIPEYVIVDSTRQDRRFRLLGHRLGRAGTYRRIDPDDEGRVLSATTGLWFQVSPDGERVLLFEHPSGRQLLNLEETEAQLLATEEKVRVAEAEVARLQAELERLRRGE